MSFHVYSFSGKYSAVPVNTSDSIYLSAFNEQEFSLCQPSSVRKAINLVDIHSGRSFYPGNRKRLQ